MKKIIFALALLLSGINVLGANTEPAKSKGVTSSAPIRFGVVGGLNVATISNVLYDNRISFQVGFKAEKTLNSLAKGLYLDGSLLMTGKGAELSILNYSEKATYLEIPINIGYKYAINDNFKIFGKAGFWVAYGIFGSAFDSANDDESDYNYDYGDDFYYAKRMENGYDDENEDEDYSGMKRFDTGIGISTGVEFLHHWQGTIGYEWGLLNVAKDVVNLKTRNFYCTVTYLF